MTPPATLHRLLDDGLSLPPEYRGGLTHHLPMALHALARLGAAAPRLQAFQAAYLRRHPTRAPARPAEPLADWTAARGDFGAFEALKAGFALDIERAGREAAVRAALPALWPGVAAAAFHGPIRVAHAVEAGHDGELAAALAYWAARWQPLPTPGGSTAAIGFDAWTQALEAKALALRSPEPLISARIDGVVRGEAWQALAGRTLSAARGDAELPARLGRWAAELYAGTGNFTVLHVVTGTRAARVLLALTGDRTAALQSLTRAVAAALLASNLHARTASPADERGWPALVRAAIDADDDHVIKLVQACAELGAADPDPAYLAAARRVLG